MAEYDPFNGFAPKGGNNNARGADGRAYPVSAQRSSAAAYGATLQPVDFSNKKIVESKWVVFSSKNVKQHTDGAAAAGAGTEGKKKNGAAKTMSEAEADEWRKEHNVTIFGTDCPPPMTSFDDLPPGAPSSVVQSFTRQKFTKPTGIQAQAWPILAQCRDMVGIAKTGSGKTLAFMVPALAHIANQPPLERNDGPIILVMAPTRELAQQIEEETKKVLPPYVKSACVFGGAPKGPQCMLLQQGCHILIATPGRLIDLLQIKRTNLLRVTYLVLDEADRMLDMGFEPQVRAVCSQIRPDRQTLMFSATWPKEIQALAAQFQREFIRIHIGSTDLIANADVTQHIIWTTEFEKFGEVRKLLLQFPRKRILIFANMKRTTEQIERQLRGLGANAMSLHGDKEQAQREFILSKFKKEPMILIATDVAARGLDVKELEVVINYDFPMVVDDYVHRVGRTGRAGNKGESFTFLTQAENHMTPHVADQLKTILEKSGQEVPERLVAWAKNSRGAKPVARPGFGNKPKMPSFSYNAGNRVSGSAAPAASTAFFGVSSAGGSTAPGKQSFRCVFDSDDEGDAPTNTRKAHRAEE